MRVRDDLTVVMVAPKAPAVKSGKNINVALVFRL